MDGNESDMAQTVITSGSSFLTNDGTMTVGEIPLLQDGSSFAATDINLGPNGSTIVSVPLLRDDFLYGGSSQSVFITNPDGTKTLLLNTAQLAVLAPSSNNSTVYDASDLVNSTISLPVISAASVTPSLHNLNLHKFSTEVDNQLLTTQTVTDITETTIGNDIDEIQVGNKVLSVIGREDVSNFQIKPPIRKGPFKCDYCDKVVDKWKQLQRHLRSHADDKPRRCTRCSASFNLEINIILHEATHSEDELLCPICMKKFSRLASLKAHLMLHEEDDNLTCPNCCDEFNTQIQLDKHMTEHLEDAVRVYTCKKCFLQFHKISQYRSHMKTHQKYKGLINSRSFKKRKLNRTAFHHECEICFKAFQKPSQLIRHKRIHTGERPYSCEVCNRSFNQKASLQTHMFMHTGERPHKCDFCGGLFSQKGNLRAHVRRVHDVTKDADQSAYRCDYCSCMFRKLGNLNAHIGKMHIDKDASGSLTSIIVQEINGFTTNNDSNNKNVNDVIQQLLELSKKVEDDPVQTQQEIQKMADEGIVSADILQQALVNSGLPTADKIKLNLPQTNSDESVPACDDQNDGDDNDVDKIQTFLPNANSNGKTLRKYTVRRSAGLKWHQCPYCSKGFKKPSDLVRHIRIHTHEKPYKCNQCFRSFTVKSTLTSHLRSHMGIKEYQCDFCNKLFSASGSLRVHMRLHTGVRPYACDICGKKFRTIGHRKTHVASHYKPRNAPLMSKKNRLEAQKRLLSEKKINIPDVSLQEPILITESGLVQSPVKGASSYDRVQNKDDSYFDRPHCCPICNRRFKKSSHIKQHIRSHTGEKPFKCTECSRSFVSNGVRKEHMRIHSGVKLYECNQCNVRFTTNGSLKRHMATHSQVRPYMCPYCQKTFKTLSSCKKHMKLHKLELAVQAAESSASNKEAFVNGNTLSLADLGAVDSEQSIQQTTSDQLENQQDFVLTSSALSQDTLNQLQQSLEQVYDNSNMNVLPPDSMSTVDQTSLGLSQSVAEVSVAVSSTSSNLTNNFNSSQQNVVTTSCSESLVSNLQSTDANSGTFTISIPGLNTQFAIQANGLNMNELASSFDGSNGNNDFSDRLKNDEKQFKVVTDVLQQNQNQENQAVDSEITGGGICEDVDDPSETQANLQILNPGDEISTAEYGISCKSPEEIKRLCAETLKRVTICRKKVLRCGFCFKEFVRSTQATLHLRTHTGEKPFDCNTCGQSFISVGVLRNHQKTHNKKGKIHGVSLDNEDLQNISPQNQKENERDALKKCQDCGTAFRRSIFLNRHMAEKHGKSQKCDVCNNCYFSDVEQLKSHVLNVHPLNASDELDAAATTVVANAEDKDDINEYPVQVRKRSRPKRANKTRPAAKETDKQKNQMADISRKILLASVAEKDRVSEIKAKNESADEARHPNKCCMCPKSFKKPSDLVRHVRIHTGEKPYICEVCSRSFTVKSTLDTHFKTHTQQKEFECHICESMYATKGSLKVHMRLHTGARPFKCPQCNEQFRTSGHRKNHMLVHKSNGSGRTESKPQKTRAPRHKKPPRQKTAVEQPLDPSKDDVSENDRMENVDDGVSLLNTNAPDVILSNNTVLDTSMLQMIQTAGNNAMSNITLPVDFLENHLLQASTTDGIQLQLPSAILGQHIQLDPISQTLQIDSSLLQHLHEQGNISITINNILQAPMTGTNDGSGVISLPTVVSADAGHVNTDSIMANIDGAKLDCLNVAANDNINTSETSSFQVSEQMSEVPAKVTMDLPQMTLVPGLDVKKVGKHACNQCGKAFKSASSLKVHQRVHNSDKTKSTPFVCDICKKSFAKPSQLDRHMRIHTGERPFVCSHCNKSFNQSNALQIHLMKHTGEKPFACPFCFQSFVQKGNLRVHMKRTHFKDKKDLSNAEMTEVVTNMLLQSTIQQPENSEISNDLNKSPAAHDADTTQNTDYLDGVVGELFPQ